MTAEAFGVSEIEKVNSILELSIEQFPEFEGMDYVSKMMARMAFNVVQESLREGSLKPDNFRSVLDFGAGYGAPTLILQKVCDVVGGRVTAVENTDFKVERIKSRLPDNEVVLGDGIEFVQEHPSEFDLITAFNIGPDNDASLFLDLARSSSAGLRENGKLLVYSDKYTMEAILSKTQAVEGAHFIPEQNTKSDQTFISEALILSKEACGKIN
jgi:SAM-dependent methyltransferase